jgi:O-antigen/teichoic acid export membrane protein
MLNTVTGAAAGLLFWFLLARAAGLHAADIGVGYAIIALGTTVGVVAKGGFDTALLRTVPGASKPEAGRLLRLAIAIGCAAAIVITAGLALFSFAGNLVGGVATPGWVLVAAIGLLLVVTWLQDAFFLAEGDARLSFRRNLVFSAARLLLPFPILLLAWPHPAALTWALALALSALAAAFFVHRVPPREGRHVPNREFLTSAARNVSGGAAEFLPGLLLAPMVVALDGEASAGYFGIAWSAASLLFLASAAISRSTLAEMVRNGAGSQAQAIRRGALMHVWLVAPAALVGAAFAPQLLSIFPSDFAREGGPALAVLCASTIVVAPAYFYLAWLRAREKPFALVAFPAAMIAALAILAPLLEARLGLVGVALAWFVANAPFGVYAAWRLHTLAREVTPHAPAPTLHRAPHVE